MGRSSDRDSGKLPSETVLWLCACGLLSFSPHVLHLPAWISILAVAGLLARYLFALRARMPSFRWVMAAAAVMGAVAVYAQFGTLLGRDAGVALLVLMLALKILETRSPRDAAMVVLLCYFLTITNFFYTQSVVAAAYALVSAGVMTAALVHLNQGAQPIRLGIKFRVALVMLAQSLPMAALLFVLFPRLSGPLWNLPPAEDEGITGLSEEMSPGSVSRLTQSDSIALRASFEGEPPPRNARYWRGPVFWHFDGRTWRPRGPGSGAQEPGPSRRDVLFHTITLEPHNEHWLPALDTPWTSAAGFTLNTSFQAMSRRPVRERKTYRIGSLTSGRIDVTLPPDERSLALQLPERSAPKARVLAARWRAQYPQDADLLRAALLHFTRNPFVYTLSPPLLTKDSVDQFLFETQRGFCEHYASSFAVLLRAAGIPARIVTGYLGGEWNAQGGYLSVLQADAHAWVEAWLPEQGWVRTDPTSAVSPLRVEGGLAASVSGRERLPLFVRQRYGSSLLNQFNLVWDNLNYQWIRWVLGFDMSTQQELLKRLGLSRPDWPVLAGIMAFGMAALSLLYSAWYLLRHSRRERDPLLRQYRRLLRKLARSGHAPQAWEGADTYAARAGADLPDQLTTQIRTAVACYTRLRYGANSAPGDLRTLRRLISALHIRSAHSSAG